MRGRVSKFRGEMYMKGERAKITESEESYKGVLR